MKVLELLAFLPLSNTFLSYPDLSCPFLLFGILSSTLVDGWTGGQVDRRTYGRLDRQTELHLKRCLLFIEEQKGVDTDTDRQTSHSIIILDICIFL